MDDPLPTPRRPRGRRAVVVVASAALVVAGGGGAAIALGDSSPAGSPAGASAAPSAGPARAVDTGTERPKVTGVVVGTVTSLTAGAVGVRDDLGTVHTLQLSAQARKRLAGPRVQRWLKAHPAVGQRVVVAVGAEGGKTVALRLRLARPHVAGTVTAVSGSTVTVVDVEGFRRSVDISGVSKPPALKRGVEVLAVGTVGPDGTTLKATRVTVVTAGAVLRGDGGRPWPGPGARERMRERRHDGTPGRTPGPDRNGTAGSSGGSTAEWDGPAPDGSSLTV